MSRAPVGPIEPVRERDGLRVLVVDDDLVDRETVRRLLARTDLQAVVTEATDPLAALGVLRRNTVDLVIRDYNFPKHDGMFLLRELRETGHATPVLMLTGQNDSALAVDLMKNGAADFLPKAGLTAHRLSVSIRHALRMRASGLAAGAVQEALRASEELNRRILESAHESILVLDLAGHILVMSRTARELLEIPDLSLLHRRGWFDLWPEGEHRTAARNALLTAAQGSVGSFVGLGPGLSGTPLWWRVSVAPVLDAEGKPERILALGILVPSP